MLAFACALSAVASLSYAQDLNLPNPLQLPDLSLVTSAEQWRDEQRGRVLELFQEHVYGRPTLGRPVGMTFNVVETDAQAMSGDATLKRVEISIPNAERTQSLTIRLTLFLPNTGGATSVPTFVLINNRPESNTDPTRATVSEFWPAEAAIARGFGIAAFHVSDLDPDDPSFSNGVHELFDGGVRAGPSSWGALAAWAWGASRVMDYFETDTRIDATRVAVLGHSRGGKAALLAGATDERFALTISNDSGEGGAALARRKVGESIQNLNTSFPHWFALNYRGYNGAPESLPVDQHELLALMAPRAVYVASASKDAWADPQGEFLSAVNAAPVYQLFGFTGLGTDQFPSVGEHIHGQQVGYHLRLGEHDLTRFDWDLYMDFFATVQIPSAVPTPVGGAGGAEPNACAASLGGVPAAGGGAPPSGAGMPSASGSAGSSEVGPGAPETAALTGDSGAGCGCRLARKDTDRNRGLLLFALVVAAAAFRRRTGRGNCADR